MAQLSIQEISESPLEPTMSTADTSNGDKFKNYEENVFILVENTDDTNAAVVTVTAQDTSENIPGFGSMSKSSITVNLATGEKNLVGPFPRKAFNDSSEDVSLAYSGDGASSVKVAVLKAHGLVKGA